MAFDFTGAAHDHHVAYTRTNASGTVSRIQAKGAATLEVRQQNAKAAFNESLQTIAGITPEQAEKVTRYYIDNKLVKIDAVNGTVRAKHGAYLDKDVILRAVEQTSPKQPWQQTKEQYGNDEDHEVHVYRAMQGGKPVPAEVRAQYPQFGYMHRDSKKHLKKSIAGTFLLRKSTWHNGHKSWRSTLANGTVRNVAAKDWHPHASNVNIHRTGNAPTDFITVNGKRDLATLPKLNSPYDKEFPQLPIRLNIGVHRGYQQGFGIEHIKVDHRPEIMQSGLSPEEFVVRMLANVSKAHHTGEGRLILRSNGKPTGNIYIELRKEKGGYYSIVTAYNTNPTGKVVWSGRITSTPFSPVPDSVSTLTAPTSDLSAKPVSPTDHGQHTEVSLKPALDDLENQTNSNVPNSKNKLNKSLRSGLYLRKSLGNIAGVERCPTAIIGNGPVKDISIFGDNHLQHDRRTLGDIGSARIFRHDVNGGDISGFSFKDSHNTLQKSESPSGEVKAPPQNDAIAGTFLLRKSYYSRKVLGERGHKAFQRRAESGKLSLISAKGIQKVEERTHRQNYALHKPAIEDLPTKHITTELLLPPPQQLDQATRDKYINTFMRSFGISAGKTATFRDAAGTELRISDRLFREGGKGPYKIFKRGRERYLPLLADAIKDPSEIWVIKTPGKSNERRYISMYHDSDGKIAGYAVFHFKGNEWVGASCYQTDDMRYIDGKRKGKLIYAKKIAVAQNGSDLGSRPTEVGATAKDNISKSTNGINKSLRSGLWLLRPADIHVADGNQKRPAVGMELSKAEVQPRRGNLLMAKTMYKHAVREQRATSEDGVAHTSKTSPDLRPAQKSGSMLPANISPSKNEFNKSLRPGLWLRKSVALAGRGAIRHFAPAVFLCGDKAISHTNVAEFSGGKGGSGSGGDFIGRNKLAAAVPAFAIDVDHNTLQKSESPSGEVKAPPQNDLTKAHVAEYDRTTASGALAHVMAHEDSRVKKYGKQLMKIRNHADLHSVRKERFAHLPHWGSLPEHTRNEILLAEEHLHRQIKRFAEPDKDKPKHDIIDRSGWKQERMFKAILQKSKGKTLCIDFDGVIADYNNGFQGTDVFGEP